MAQNVQRPPTLSEGKLDRLANTFDRYKKPNWRNIIDVLPKGYYNKQQIELFGMACLKPRGSPTKALVNDLIRRGKTSADLLQCLNILSQKGFNVSSSIDLLQEPDNLPGSSNGLHIDHTPIMVIAQPASRIGVAGQEIEIRCEAVGEEPLTFTWFHNQDRIEVHSDIFRIRSLSKSSAGYYICRVSNSHSYAFTNWACIRVFSDSLFSMETAPLITTHPRSVSCNVNDEVRLFCDALGNPSPDFQWYFHDGKIAKATEKFFVIQAVKLSDSGLYSCVASNGYGTARTIAANVNISENRKEQNRTERKLPIIVRGTRPSLDPDCGNSLCSSLPRNKVALLIGNQNYIHEEDLGRLVHPLNDTRDIAAALASIGFTVVSLADLNLKEFERAVSVFHELLTDEMYAVFYFAGHGFEVQGESYLMPVDATSSFSVEENFPASKILDCMVKRKPKLTMLMLDCCRTTPDSYLSNPLPGLCQALQAMHGNVVLCFGCCSQSRVMESPLFSNGFFAEAFCKHVKNNILIDYFLFEVSNTIYRQNIIDPATGRAQVIYRHSTLVEPISLCDPLLPPAETNEILQHRLELWSILHQAPASPITVFQDDTVKLDFIFSAEFSNVLLIQSQIHSLANCTVQFFMPSSIGGAKVDILKDETLTKGAGTQREVVKISNLELLEGEVTIHIQLQYKVGEQYIKQTAFYTLPEEPLYARINYVMSHE